MTNTLLIFNFLIQVVDSDDEWETLCEQTDPEVNPLQACLFIEKAGDNFAKKLKTRLNASMLQVGS